MRDTVGTLPLTAVLVLASIGESHPTQPADKIPPGHVPHPAAYALVAVAGLALAARRRWPLAVFAVSAGAVLGYTALGYVNGAALLAPMIALYTVAASGMSARLVVPLGAVTAGSLLAAQAVSGPFGAFGGPAPVVPFEVVASVAVGLAVANRRAYVAEAEARAERAERTREEEARRRVDAERLRIARELHDVVAHTMATINVQAAAAGRLLAEGRSAQAGDALRTITSASRDGLRELRAILHVLRQQDEAEPTGPAPGVDQIDALVAATCRAGLPTTLRVTGERVPLPPAADLTGYRIVQESLTNAVRHAGPATATVTLHFAGTELRIDVTDTGVGPQAQPADHGYGLRGMAERAAAIGGTVDAGPAPHGGFTVHARLPLGGASAGAPAAGDASPAGSGT
ncbi:two-component sensor histidine kinase [Gandjariella thermophila]|uniref:histidine kinase n=1 Tax=Gandjariella thermophila TaxID=1931992 RepID=A0A4D4JA48_9PSEU|nr:two-component sensor histidine kinase [Gandjariella thermophila]